MASACGDGRATTSLRRSASSRIPDEQATPAGQGGQGQPETRTIGELQKADRAGTGGAKTAQALKTGAGAVIRKDVPAGALALSVAPQRNIEGWVEKNRPGTGAAEVAARARSAQKAGDGAQEAEEG